MLANEDWWTGLAAADRELIDGAFGSAAEYAELMRAAESRDLAAAVERGEITLVELTPAELALWRAPATSLVQRLIAELGGESASVYAAIVAGRSAWAGRNQ